MLLPEHNLYFCYAGLLICIFSSAAIRQAAQARKRYLTAALGGFAIFYIGLSLYLNFNWQDEIRFFERNLRCNKNSAFNFMDYANLGYAYERAKFFSRAEENFKLAAEEAGADPYFYNMLATFYIRRANPDKALEILELSKSLDEQYPSTQILIGLAKERREKLKGK